MKDLNDIINKTIDYANDNTAGTISTFVILLFILVRKPRLFIVLLLIGLAGIGVVLLFDKISGIGIGK